MPEPVLRLENLSKRYDSLLALDDVSLTVPAGEIFALLGPNGAGKTTLIGCVTGLVTPTSGHGFIMGHDVLREPTRTKMVTGLVPQELNFDPFFDVSQVLRYQIGLFGIRPTDERVSELLRAMSLQDKANVNTRQLSGGMKRRLLIAKALVHGPKLLFLDEPTAGVDVELRDELWAYVRRLRERGTTVVLTTHYLHEAEALADRVGILREGRLVEVAPVDRLIERFGHRVVRLKLGRPLAELPAPLAELEGVLSGDGSELVFPRRGQDGEDIGRLLRAVVAADLVVTDIEARQPTLEEVFRQLVQAPG